MTSNSIGLGGREKSSTAAHREPPTEPPVRPGGQGAPTRRPDEPPPPRRSWVGWLIALVVLAAIGGGAYWWYTHARAAEASAAGGGKGGGKDRVVPVVTATATKGDLPIYLNGLGTVTGLYTVTVRARVDGELTDVAFEEGQQVEAGQFLAQIDPRPFDVQIQQAQGQLTKDEAALANAEKDRDRYKEAGDAISRQQLDTAESSVKQFGGAVATDKGQLGNAQLQKTYSRIVAPISGRIGLRLVDQGNIVHATDTTGLAVITQVQPIAVVFTLPQDDIPRLTKRMREVEAAKDPTQYVEVEAYDRDARTKLATGKVLAIDNQVDPNSGTIRVKATFDNKDGALYPNQFVNARLLVETRRAATLVPPAALQRGTEPGQTFVYVVKADETVAVRPVDVGPAEADRVVIEKGLEPGEVVATEGVDKLREGAKVKASGGGGKGGATRTAGAGTRPAGASSRPAGGGGGGGGGRKGGKAGGGGGAL